MPWTVKDVDDFKKGLTPAQKKKWVSIANGVLKDCQAKGGKDCEGKAIRIANSKFEEKQMSLKTEKIPKGALRFVDQDCHAFAELDSDEKPPQLKMTAYNGKIIKDHWWWGDLAMDLNGMKFPAGKFPILENHMTDRKVGFHKGKPDVSENKLELIPGKTQFVSTETAKEFIKLSSEGFPYQASIYAKPTEIQRLMKDETSEVNGFTMRGPGTIWRKSEFKEASVCVFGWDSQTKASAFSKDETEDVEFFEEVSVEDITEQDQFTEGGEIMNLEELKEKHPDLVTQLTEEVTDKVTNELTLVFGEEKKILEDENKKLSKDLEDRDDRLTKLEKKDALRDEKDRKETADKIWKSKLSESDIDEHLWPKVQNMVSYKKFVKDEDLDTEAFSTAIDEEIKDWEGRVATMSTSGMGFVNREPEGGDSTQSSETKEENTKLSNSLLKRAGQQVA